MNLRAMEQSNERELSPKEIKEFITKPSTENVNTFVPGGMRGSYSDNVPLMHTDDVRLPVERRDAPDITEELLASGVALPERPTGAAEDGTPIGNATPTGVHEVIDRIEREAIAALGTGYSVNTTEGGHINFSRSEGNAAPTVVTSLRAYPVRCPICEKEDSRKSGSLFDSQICPECHGKVDAKLTSIYNKYRLTSPRWSLRPFMPLLPSLAWKRIKKERKEAKEKAKKDNSGSNDHITRLLNESNAWF
ncbi:MAG: hypothetical protein GY861_05880 [bacterium]|nr:hypothetical protein [bacterium]